MEITEFFKALLSYLITVRSIAEQYGGVAKFSDCDGKFFSDVMMLINDPMKMD